MKTITKQIIAFGRPLVIGCDAACAKAWGISTRPRLQVSENPDDYAFLADGELGEAPEDPGTYEGGHAKPTAPDERLNKWCFRECERCASAPVNEAPAHRDFSKRRYNIPAHDPGNAAGQATSPRRDGPTPKLNSDAD